MAEGFTNDLIFEASFVALAALLIAWRDLPLIVAVPTVLLRVGLTTLYFAEFIDGSWFMFDDLSYFNDAALIRHDGFNPIDVLITPEGLNALSYSASHHILYQWWNLVSMYIFGEHYYAPVFLNVLFTFVVGFLLNRIAELLGFSRNYRIGLELFYLLHWDVVTWSSFVNLKECLVQLLIVSSMYCIVRFCQRRDWWSVVGFLVTVQLFFWLRFYLSVLILVATVLWALWQWRDQRKYLLVPIACACMYVALQELGDSGQLIDVGNCVYGFGVVVLAPLPWVQINDIWWYMAIAAVFHFIFLVPSVVGAWQLWKTGRTTRLLLIFLMVVLGFYSIVEVEGMRGARQRVQLSFIIAWIQFQFLWSLRPVTQPKAVPASHLSNNVKPAPRRQPMLNPV